MKIQVRERAYREERGVLSATYFDVYTVQKC